MTVPIGTLTGVPREIQVPIFTLKRAIESMEGRVRELAGRESPATLTIREIRHELSSAGTNPLNLTGLIGAAAGITTGTHAERLSAAAKGLWYETDRHFLYIAVGATWTFCGGASYQGLESGLYGDLGAADDGIDAFAIDTGLYYRWTGTSWYKTSGLLIDVFASRPGPFVGVQAGVIFMASDRGYQAWRLDYGLNAWVLIPGIGDPTAGNLGSITGGLGANDAGYRYNATDYDREYHWSGAAYGDAPGQPTRTMVVYSDQVLGTGWTPANGAVVTISTAAGGTAGYTTPTVPAIGTVNAYVRL